MTARNEMLTTARALIARGLSPIPVPFREKGPAIPNWTSLRLTEADAEKHFGRGPVNIGVLLGEASEHLVDVDLDSPEAAALADWFLPNTDAIFGRPSKPRSHFLYRAVGVNTRQYATKTAMIVELRSTGAQTVFPPSTHVSGECILWAKEGEPALVDADSLRSAVAELAAASLLVANWPAKGTRQDTTLALAGTLLTAGWEEERVVHFLDAVLSVVGCEEKEKRLDAVRDTAAKVRDGSPVTQRRHLQSRLGEHAATVVKWLGLTKAKRARENSACTDAANAERLVRWFGDDLRFAPHLGKWLVWRGDRWSVDTTNFVISCAIDVARRIHQEAAKSKALSQQQELSRWAIQSQNKSRLEGMIWAARPALPIRSDELDVSGDLLNVANGTIDLRTGDLRPHQRSDFITRLAGAHYDEDAKSPVWDEFLATVCDGDLELVAYLQRAIGYASTGETSEQCFFLCYGSGANGKSTFLDTVHEVLGDYAKATEFRTLLLRDRFEGIRNDLAALHGPRFVTASEPSENKRLDESVIKQLTGGDKISARFLYGEYFEFAPRFKLFLAANHRPEIRGVDEGIWRRVRLIPFDVTIPRERRDRRLRQRLRRESSGILNWIVRGALDWRQRGLDEPQAVTDATNDYRNASDFLAEFISACLERCNNVDDYAPVGDVYLRYLEWAHHSEHEELRKDVFAKAMIARGLQVSQRRVRGVPKRLYDGWTFQRPDPF